MKTTAADRDTVELFARRLAEMTGVDLGEIPAVEFIRGFPRKGVATIADEPTLAVIDRVTRQWDAPIPLEHMIPTVITLSREAYDELIRMAGNAS